MSMNLRLMARRAIYSAGGVSYGYQTEFFDVEQTSTDLTNKCYAELKEGKVDENGIPVSLRRWLFDKPMYETEHYSWELDMVFIAYYAYGVEHYNEIVDWIDHHSIRGWSYEFIVM